MIDFRSDTITRPSMALRKKMVNTETGDVVFYDDPTVNELQTAVAELFGKEAGMFVPSGTMGNLLGCMAHCREKGSAAIIGDMTHINCDERGNLANLGGIMPITLRNQPDGTIDLDEMEFFIKEKDPHNPVCRLIALESSHQYSSGRVLSTKYFKKVKKIARKNKLKMHLDGARALNAAASLGISPAEMTKDFDTVSVCMSKGLGAPIGTVLVGSAKDIQFSAVTKKLLGGNLRQAGIIARAALENLKTWEQDLS